MSKINLEYKFGCVRFEKSTLMNNARLDFIDVGKGIGILILITITHNFFLPNSILNFDGYILIPFFFFLSGFVFQVKESDKIPVFIKRKFKTYILPYIFFAFLGFLYTIILKYHHNQLQIVSEIGSFLFALMDGTPSDLQQYFVNPLWFVYSLFFVVVIYRLIFNQKIWIKYIIIFSLFIIGRILNSDKDNYNDSYFANIDVVFIALLFFDFGYYLSKKKLELKKYQSLLYFILFLSFAISFSSLRNDRVILAYNIIPNLFYFLIISFSGILSLFFLCIAINKNKFLILIGKNAFTIFGIHWILLHGIFYSIFYHILKEPVDSWVSEKYLSSYFIVLIFSAGQLLIILPITKYINLLLKAFSKL